MARVLRWALNQLVEFEKEELLHKNGHFHLPSEKPLDPLLPGRQIPGAVRAGGHAGRALAQTAPPQGWPARVACGFLSRSRLLSSAQSVRGLHASAEEAEGTCSCTRWLVYLWRLQAVKLLPGQGRSLHTWVVGTPAVGWWGSWALESLLCSAPGYSSLHWERSLALGTKAAHSQGGENGC